jgi:hypothetical protein
MLETFVADFNRAPAEGLGLYGSGCQQGAEGDRGGGDCQLAHDRSLTDRIMQPPWLHKLCINLISLFKPTINRKFMLVKKFM